MKDETGSAQVEFVVEPAQAGERLDRFVAVQASRISRSRIQELILAGLVLVNGAPAKAAHRVKAGEVVRVDPQERPGARAEAEDIPLDVIYEDEDVIAVNKRSGMTVHAGAGIATGTLVNALLGRGQGLSSGGDELRPGIVHRLDKDTSGVILVAKNDAAHATLGEAFRARTVKKTYLALVQGILEGKSGRIDFPIGRDPHRRTRMAAQHKAWHGTILHDAREARTDWRVLASIDSTTLVEVQLHTGRTHQIRVHFSALKHPVVGDTLYGAAEQLRVAGSGSAAKETTMEPLGRNFLHAAKLGFAQPRTGQWKDLRAPLPPELRDFLKRLAKAAGDDPGRIDAALAGYL